jgi:dTMP kinase
MIIVIEGPDAAGKKTQSLKLAEALNTPETGESVVMSFPRYDGPFGDIILRCLKKESVMYSRVPDVDGGSVSEYAYCLRDDTTALRGLFTLDQYEGAAEIRRLHELEMIVILDRYWPSNVCYGAEDGFNEDILKNVSSSLPAADVYFFIDVSVEEATRRRPEARDRYERDKPKLARVRQRYLDLWWLEQNHSFPADGRGIFYTKPLWIVINGEQEATKITEQMLCWVRLLQHVPVRREAPIFERSLDELDPHVAENLRNQIEERVKQKR